MNNALLTVYHFIVNWGGTNESFLEVSGLNIENEIIEYREGGSSEPIPIKFPGIRKYSNIQLTRGIVKGDTEFHKWMNTIQHNKVEKRNITISLLDENHAPVRVWKVRNAWPCKIVGPYLNAESSEVAMETIELAHEGLEVEGA